MSVALRRPVSVGGCMAMELGRAWGYLRNTVLLWIPLGLVVNLIQRAPFFSTIAVPVSLGLTYLFTSFGTDESSGWEVFRLTLPLGRRVIVGGRYLAITLQVAVSAAAGVLVAVADMALGSALGIEGLNLSGEGDSSWALLWAFFALAVGLTSLICAVSTPLLFRSGLQKGFRTLPLLVVILGCAAGWLLSADGPFGPGIAEAFVRWVDQVGLVPLGWLVLAVAAVLWAASFWVAAALYERRQF